MTRNVISPEEGAELVRLYKEHVEAVERAGSILRTHGVGSVEFSEADKAAGAIRRQIDQILGDARQHWMDRMPIGPRDLGAAPYGRLCGRWMARSLFPVSFAVDAVNVGAIVALTSPRPWDLFMPAAWDVPFLVSG